MDFKAVQVICMTVNTLMDEMNWATYGSPDMHTPVIQTQEDYHKLDVLMDILGTLTRMMDTRIPYVTSEGKLIREWVGTILELGNRYKRELELLERVQEQTRTQ
ncbi:MAG: hypothetical protein AB1646_14295 [Thermodesulfobacteriota bacterium]